MYESRRREPDMPRTRIALALGELEVDDSVTSFASMKPPLGSGAFQLRPNFVRSTTVSNWRPSLVLPNGSSIGPTRSPSR